MVKIDIAPDKNLKPGFVGSNWELEKFPYPLLTNTVEEAYVSHILEHLNNPIECVREICRSLKIGGTLTIKVPHYSGRCAWMNMEHKRPYALDSIESMLLADGASFKPITGMEIISKKLHYSSTNYKPNNGPRIHERLIDVLLNINPRISERIFIYLVGGVEEVEIKLKKSGLR